MPSQITLSKEALAAKELGCQETELILIESWCTYGNEDFVYEYANPTGDWVRIYTHDNKDTPGAGTVCRVNEIEQEEEANLEKLFSRLERQQIQGNGDNR